MAQPIPTTPSSADAPPPSSDPHHPPRPFHAVHGRTPLTREGVRDRAERTEDPRAVDTAAYLFDGQREDSRRHAERLARLAPLYVEPDSDSLAHDEVELALAVALRCTAARAAGLLNDAHRASTLLPRTLERLSAGDLPVDWFQRVLRAITPLTPEAAQLVDDHVSSWDLEAIPVVRFRRELRLLIAWVTSEIPAALPPEPEECRSVDIEIRDELQGLAELHVVGPIPEIMGLAHRLDACAIAVQQAQRSALADGTPIPFDPEGTVAGSSRALSRASLRYLVLTGSVLETGAVPVPQDRFRLSVTVPAMTLLGCSDAPGMIEGMTPIPAEMARRLAAGQKDWYRILTDPVTGVFLPLPATRYKPSQEQLEHLRLRHPVCAAPGCTRPTVLASEADHIEEFDHEHPEHGGRTDVANLHLLCWRHHQLKTARRIDPTRGGPDATTTSWHIGPPPTKAGTRLSVDAVVPDHRDLLSPLLARELRRAWSVSRSHRRRLEKHHRAEQAPTPDRPPAEDEDPPPF